MAHPKGSAGGGGRSAGGAVGSASAADLTRSRVGRTISTLDRAGAYLRKTDRYWNEGKIEQVRQRRRDAIGQAVQLGGVRLNLRTRGQAAARRSWQTRQHLDFTRVGGSGRRPDGSGRYKVHGTTRGQGNLLTGSSSDVVRGRRMRRVG